ncbi:putative speedy protein-like protein 3 [Trichosurus vulpecula]|uniref:putative speedy protein-like protein 3 n=1 Tax=Trichosurus vulpecula TaxID=9337 RepID=UPI00186B0A8F|nr:putative speedy protein-like protein 3 [Trichosurus vulpecula]
MKEDPLWCLLSLILIFSSVASLLVTPKVTIETYIPSTSGDLTQFPSLSEERNESRQKRKRKIWSVIESTDTKLVLKRRKIADFRPEDLEAFFRLLEDPVIRKFLDSDSHFKVADKYLLSIVVEYFGRVRLPAYTYNRIHFFVALFIANQIEEDDMKSKFNMMPALFGKRLWRNLYHDFRRIQRQFIVAMNWRVLVTCQICDEIQAQAPTHWVWDRDRDLLT